MPRSLHIAALIGTSCSWGTEMVRGIADFANRYDARWHLTLNPRGYFDPVELSQGWRGHGIVAAVIHAPFARKLKRLRVPVVNVSDSPVPGADFVRVVVDEEIMGRMAAEHLLERSFQSFGVYYRPANPFPVTKACLVFQDTVRAQGFPCSNFGEARRSPKYTYKQVRPGDLARWLHQLPKPVGVYTWDWEHGRQVADACLYADIPVPEQVAIVAGDNDDLGCQITFPPLSGVDANLREVGYQAARILSDMMAGKRLDKAVYTVEPAGIAVRKSTDTLAVEDPLVRQAAQFIRQHASEPISARDVAAAVGLSRRWLDSRFTKALGRTPADDIRRTRLERAQQLLTTSETISINQVAAACGFDGVKSLIRLFRGELGMTPTEFRRQVRRRRQRPYNDVV